MFTDVMELKNSNFLVWCILLTVHGSCLWPVSFCVHHSQLQPASC